LVLEYADKKLKGDKEVVLAAVKQTAYALRYADKKLKGDKEVVLEAVKQNGSLEYADKKLKGDKEVVLAAVKQEGRALQFANKKLKADKEVVLAAVKNARYKEGSNLQYADKELKADKEVVLAAVKYSGNALQYADGKLKADKEVVLEAVKQEGAALAYADKKLKTEIELLVGKKEKKIFPYIFVGPELTYYHETIKKSEINSIKEITNRLIQFIETAEHDHGSAPVIGQLSSEKGKNLIKNKNARRDYSVRDSNGNDINLKIKNIGRLIEKPKKNEIIFIWYYQYISSEYHFTPIKHKKDLHINIKCFDTEAIIEPVDNLDFEFECESADKPSEIYLQILCDDRQFENSIDFKEDLVNQFAAYLL